MMVRTDIKVTRFDDGDFYVDIVEFKDRFEAFIYKKDYPISEFIYDAAKECADGSVWDFDRFVKELVEPNLDEYEHAYEGKVWITLDELTGEYS